MENEVPTAEAVLERWFALQDLGQSPDLAELCGGDPALRARVERLLGYEALVTENLPGRPATVAGPEIPGFEILAPIGQGAMGRVWLARERELGRLVALKVFGRPTLGETERLRIRREAEVAASLEHPGIVPVFGFGEAEDHLWISMRWLEGPALDALGAPLTPREAASLGVTIAQALHAAHEVGIVHRDVKPANILMDRGRAYLVDFGLSRSISHEGLTEADVLPGTLLYMAPERLRRDGAVLDPRSDVYSLGATLHQLVSGQAPHPPSEPSALVRAIVEDPPEPLRLRGRDRDLEAILQRALEKDPGRRFASAAAFADELQRFVDGEPVRSRRVGHLGRLARRIAQHPRTALGVGLLGLGAAVLGVVLLTSHAAAEESIRRRLEAVGQDVEAGRLGRAAAGLHTLDRGREDVDAAWSALEGRATLENLLDAVLDRPEDQSPNRLRRLLEAVARTSGRGRSGRTTALARALAHHVLGEPRAAIEALEAADAGGPPGPASRAIRAVVEDRDDVALPEEPPADGLECAFVAHALRMLEFADARRRRFIDAAASHAGDPRAQYFSAIDYLDRDRLDVAREKLEDLALAEKRTPGRDLLLAWIAIQQRRYEDAEALIAGVEELEAPSPPRAVVLRAMVATSRGQAEVARRILRSGLESWPGDPSIEMNLAMIAADPEERDRLLQRVAEGQALPGRALARAYLLARRQAALLEGSGLPPGRRGEARALIRELEEFAGTCRFGYARSIALLARAILVNHLVRDAETLLEAARAAFEAEPRNPDGVLLLAEVVRALRPSAEGTLAQSLDAVGPRLTPALAALAEAGRLGPWAASEAQRELAAALLPGFRTAGR